LFLKCSDFFFFRVSFNRVSFFLVWLLDPFLCTRQVSITWLILTCLDALNWGLFLKLFLFSFVQGERLWCLFRLWLQICLWFFFVRFFVCFLLLFNIIYRQITVLAKTVCIMWSVGVLAGICHLGLASSMVAVVAHVLRVMLPISVRAFGYLLGWFLEFFRWFSIQLG